MKILSFYINNFRSLVDFKIDNFDSTTIFYGENNAGKSNVLYALYTVFKRKRKNTGAAEQNFYEGIVEGFSNNFYQNNTDSIDFLVEMILNKSEIIVSNIISNYLQIKDENIIKIEGNITKENNDSGNIKIQNISCNDEEIYYNKEKIAYFPGIASFYINKPEYDPVLEDEGFLSDSFTSLIEPLNDCVTLISSNRDMYKTSFSIMNHNYENIDPSTFKSFLYSLYLSEDKYQIFELIRDAFKDEPFSFGEISFSRDKQDLLEIMLKQNDIRLPIKHYGSGILQCLYVIAIIINSKHKIICIEELEQNLSPTLQSKILKKLQELLKDSKIGDVQQIILSSHSHVFFNNKFGMVYFLVKDNCLTKIKERKNKTLPKGKNNESDFYDIPETKEYFKPVFREDTYTAEELREKVRENLLQGEKAFKD